VRRLDAERVQLVAFKHDFNGGERLRVLALLDDLLEPPDF
jgi:hypothetical protein